MIRRATLSSRDKSVERLDLNEFVPTTLRVSEWRRIIDIRMENGNDSFVERQIRRDQLFQTNHPQRIRLDEFASELEKRDWGRNGRIEIETKALTYDSFVEMTRPQRLASVR